jgi:asparagine synthase (glutamine-hydrolysing)
VCGIYGKIARSGGLSISDCIAATHLLEHRGPDGYGFEYGDLGSGTRTLCHNRTPDGVERESGGYFLGHRRLSIVDLSEGAFQPMESACGRYSVVFNGEIYNYVELWDELKAAGCTFKTDHSDTEVILNAYDTWGVECLQKFRGMFAFALLDRAQQKLFVARDRIGKKSVYFELTEESFTFASELPSIVRFGGPRDVDVYALNLYLELGYVPHPYSIYRGISKLPPATYAMFDIRSHRVELKEYWDPLSDIDESLDAGETRKRTKALLADAVRYRLRADVSVGAFISGGTDSTLIVKNISELSKQKLDIYGADFPDTDRSERQYIEAAAARYRQNLKLSSIDLSHVGNIEAIVKVFDEPFDGASSIALFDLFREAAKDHKIIVTGDGGDEMFAGYTRYETFPRKDRLVRWLRRARLPALVLGMLGRLGILPGRLESLAHDLAGDTYTNFSGLNTSKPFTSMLKREHRRAISDGAVFKPIVERIREKRLPLVKALQYFELKTILPGRMLYKVDRFSMAYSVEARAPFLDHELAQFAFTIPDRINIRGKVTKAVLKEILAEDFDAAFVHRTKQGFGNPLSLWFRDADPASVFGILLDRQSRIFAFLDYQATHSFLPQLKSGYRGAGEKAIWRVLVLAHFLEANRSWLRTPA